MEKAFAGVGGGGGQSIFDEGYQVIAPSTRTGIDSHNKDDRMVALNLYQHTLRSCSVTRSAMDELNDLEMAPWGPGELDRRYARLHSAIISMNLLTRRLTINYEHDLPGLCNNCYQRCTTAIDIRHLLDWHCKRWLRIP